MLVELSVEEIDSLVLAMEYALCNTNLDDETEARDYALKHRLQALLPSDDADSPLVVVG